MFKKFLSAIAFFILQPVTLMTTLLVAGLITFILFYNESLKREQQDFINYSETLVTHFFSQMQSELAKAAKGYVRGDDIAQKVAAKIIDTHWFNKYGQAASHALQMDYLALLRPDSSPIYAICYGIEAKITDLSQWSAHLKVAVQEKINHPGFKRAQGVIKIGKHYYLVIIEHIKPINHEIFADKRQFGYLLLMRHFSVENLPDTLKGLHLNQPHITDTVQKNSETGRYPLIGLNNQPIAYLAWHIAMPSQELQNLWHPQMVAILLIVVLLVVLITLYMLAIQKDLLRAKERMRLHSETLQNLVSYKTTLEGHEQAFLQMVTECIAKVLTCSEVIVHWFDHKTLRLVCLDHYHSHQKNHSLDTPLTSESYANWFQIQTAHQNKNSYSRIHYFSAHHLNASILLHGELIGVLHLYVKRPPLAQDERNFLCSISDLIALSMETGQRLRAEAALHKSEYFDASTGLPNRLSFMQFLQKQIIQSDAPFAILAVGLVGLRAMHDDLGHQQTEVLLCNLAEHLRAYRLNESALSRLDVYRFALFWQPAQTDNITQKIQSMQHALSAPISVGEHLIHPKVRVGVSLFPNDADSAQSLLQCAEFALGRAQKNGAEPLLFFDEELNQQVKAYYLLEQAMRDDIESAAFSVALQPLIDLRNGAIIGAEALLRWYRAGQGQISPEKFIPLAEESGLIHVLWQQVLDEVLQFLVKWQHKLPAQFSIALNVSMVQFKQPGFIDYITSALAAQCVSPNRIEVELTESVSLDLYHHAPEILHGLRQKGIHIVVDDFGTGYSSLSYLHDLQVDKLKIDKKFIDNMLVNDKNASLVKMILSLSKSLELKTVAEGIETLAQAEFLKQYECDVGQGYYFAKPMSIADFEQYLKTIL